MAPNFNIETNLMAQGYRTIAGIDEVGRGPLAGPVCAAAVVLDPVAIPDGLDDSKRLTARQRNAALSALMAVAQVGVGWASVEEIDELNILRASHVAMVRAVKALPVTPDVALIDGNMIPNEFPTKAQTLIKGDSKSQSIAAASIVAKIKRDLVMWDLAQQYPGYGWDTNMGYPTPAHKIALQDLGVTPHHRRSFKPVHNILYQE